MEPDWVLERRDTTRDQLYRRGRAIRPRFNDSEQLCVDALLEAVTAGDCFDFEYVPHEGDVLRLCVRLHADAHQRRNVRFRFVDGRWTHDRSLSLAGWRAQMVESQRGQFG